MEYTTKGYRLPEPDDSTFWDSYNFDIQRLNDHDHDGSNSTLLRPGAVNVNSTDVVVIDWSGSGPFTKTVLFPGAWSMTWGSGDVCPVIAIVRDANGRIVNLDQTREASGLGIVFTTYAKFICTIGLY